MFTSDRVKLIPFERHFSQGEQDMGLKHLFRQKENISGIFNWLTEGYMRLYVDGMNTPEKIAIATKEYRQETDIVGTFLLETVQKNESHKVQTSLLYKRYVAWAKDNGYRPMNNKNMMAELRKRYTIKRDGTRGNEVHGLEFLVPG